MPIMRRDASAPAVQVPARKAVADDGVLKAMPNMRRAALALYQDTHPSTVPVGDLAHMLRYKDNNQAVDVVYRDRIKGRMSAIRAFCVFCIGGQPQRVKMCPRTECALWPFRMGSNGLR